VVKTKRVYVYFILLAFLLTGCSSDSQNLTWESQKKTVDPWELSVSAKSIVDDNNLKLTYEIELKNISDTPIDNVDIKLNYPSDWPMANSTQGWVGKYNFDVGENKKLTLVQIHDISASLTLNKIKAIEVKMQWNEGANTGDAKVDFK